MQHLRQRLRVVDLWVAGWRYGSAGGVVMLYLSALMVLLGAVLNAQSERQTREDSTEGPPRALGQRDARAADTVGASKG